ncbi:MAG: hypothetical protein HFE95_07200 [Acutalibacter sp.]|jgi:hypothetical protein|nr:hypothetical protein [Acutalibacter sp.]
MDFQTELRGTPLPVCSKEVLPLLNCVNDKKVSRKWQDTAPSRIKITEHIEKRKGGHYNEK